MHVNCTYFVYKAMGELIQVLYRIQQEIQHNAMTEIAEWSYMYLTVQGDFQSHIYVDPVLPIPTMSIMSVEILLQTSFQICPTFSNL